MRHDTRLDRGIRFSQSWDTNPVGDEDAADVDRMNADQQLFARMSLSGFERNKLFVNHRGDNFTDISGLSGIDSIKDSRTVITWDFDRDGWQDVAVTNINKPILQLYRNRMGEFEDAQDNRVIAITLVGGNKTASGSEEFSSRDAYGARLRIQVGDQWLHRELRCGEGLAAQKSRTLLVGLGEANQADTIEILWPSGRKQDIPPIAAGNLVTVYENPEETEDQSGFNTEPYLRSIDMATLTEVNPTPDTLSLVGGGPGTELILYTSMATWCPSCKQHLPELARIRDYFAEDQLSVHAVPVDLEDTAAMLDQYVSNYEPAYQMMTGLSEEQRTHYTEFVEGVLNREALPSSVITDAEGNVLRVFAGVPTVSDIKQLLQQ